MSPRTWSKTARRQHVASLLYQLAEVLRSMGSGATFLGDQERSRLKGEDRRSAVLYSESQLSPGQHHMSGDFKFQLPGPANSGGSNCPISTLFIQPPPLIFPPRWTLRLHKAADALFTRSTLFNVWGVGVYKYVNLLIFPQASVSTTL